MALPALYSSTKPLYKSILQISSVAKLSSEDFTISEVFIILSAASMPTPACKSRISIPQAKDESTLARLPLPIPSDSTTYAMPRLSIKLS